MRCAYHPNTPTRLRCNRCGKPICVRCVMQTSVGQRCRECARVRPTVTYQTDLATTARAVGAGLALAFLIGTLWGVLNRAGLGRVGTDWGFWFSLLLGFGVAEGISLAANRKRGPSLQAIAIGAVLLGAVVSRVVLNARAPRPVSLDAFLGQPVAVAQQLGLGLVPLLFVGMACAIAYVRFR